MGARSLVLPGFTLCALLAAAPLQAQAPAAAVSLDDLGWLAGTWRGEVKGAGGVTRFETHYTAPEGGVILSASKAFRTDGKLGWFEFERFELREGVLSVTPYPGGRPGVSFTLVELDAAAKKAVFANPAHDYPKRITYQRLNDGELRFLVAGGEGEQAPVMEFTLSRVD